MVTDNEKDLENDRPWHRKNTFYFIRIFDGGEQRMVRRKTPDLHRLIE